MGHFYSKQISVTLLILFFSLSLFAQQSQDLWSKTSKSFTSKDNQVLRKSEPSKSNFYQLDLARLKARLANAPLRGASSKPSNVIVHFPNAEGGLEAFRVKEAPVMVPEFQAKHPDMRAYVGQGIDNPAAIIRFSVTPLGLHTMTLNTKQGAQYIDPYSKDGKNYIVYSKRNLPPLDKSFACEFIDESDTSNRSDNESWLAKNADDGKMRTFRLALACSAEYGNYHGGTEISIKAAMNVTMTRVNGIFENELSVTMQMIENASIIYWGDVNADPYTNDSGSTMLGENQTEIDAKIGDANYDIGHVFSTGGGGIASLNSPCRTGFKARGVTGLTNPVGDVFDIEYVCHEMGHQYGANHTFNSSAGNCSGNRNASTAYEPASGTTIMSYAGICTPENVQQNADTYFHQISLQEMWANIESGFSTCASDPPSGNTAPTAEAGANYTIPISTPYKLTGSSTDAVLDGTASHTFTWEQWDLTTNTDLPTQFDAEGPLVRSFEGTDSPTRYIPRLSDILTNGGVSTTWEILSVVNNRDLDFQLTVRDNDARGGQTATDNMTVTTSNSSGPFLVTSQNVANSIVWTPSTTETVTWNVANTDMAPVSAANVNILLSTDGGLTFPHVLASSTPNDGSQDITVPSVSGAYCRVMVEGDGNIFFNINDEDFAVGNYTYETTDVCDDYFFNANVAVQEDDMSYAGYPLNIPDSQTISDININVNITHTNNGDLYYAYRAPFEGGGLHELASGICPGSANTDLTFDDEGSVVNCGSTNNGDLVIPQTALSLMDGQDSAGDWIFFITDINIDGTIATWNTATITICRAELVPTLDNTDISFEDTFSIYPNPNNGSFNIKLDKPSGNNIDVAVYDLRGRSIFYNSYKGNSGFNQNINLNHVQAGMYLVKVSDGERSATKKIIIK